MCVRIAAAALTAVCVANGALAQDASLPTVKSYDWTGVYVGVNAAYGSATVSTPATETITGVLAGGQIGANYQFGQVVVGGEIDGDWSSLRGDFNVPWLATARLRVGGAYDRIQYFATGGVATLKYTPPVIPGAVLTSSTRTAWVAGVGSESAINRNLIFQLQALYLQLVGSTTTVPPTPMVSGRVYELIVRAGLSYKFNWND
jgi:outer membrane immunogenic protein